MMTSDSQSSLLELVRLPGLTDYATAWALQRAVHAEVADGLRPDTVLLLEHPPTITMGRRGGWHNLVTPPEQLVALGFELFHIDRGGDITYHGPGQLVGYPIVDLRRADGLALGDFVRGLEQAHIDVLAARGLQAARDPGFTGVWCGNDKITAIGVRVSRWTTLHGFAVNATTRLDDFDHIVACGLDGRGVTSLARLSDTNDPGLVDALATELGDALARVFDRRAVRAEPDTLPRPDPDEIEALRAESRFQPSRDPDTITAGAL